MSRPSLPERTNKTSKRHQPSPAKRAAAKTAKRVGKATAKKAAKPSARTAQSAITLGKTGRIARDFKAPPAVRTIPVRLLSYGKGQLRIEDSELDFVSATVELLSLAGLKSAPDNLMLLNRSRHGLSFEVVDLLRDWTSREVISKAIGPPSTLQRWRKSGKKLTGAPAEGALRLVALVSLAGQVFGDPVKAGRWLTKPKQNLDPGRPGATPLEIADTEMGGRLVEERLVQIASGMHA